MAYATVPEAEARISELELENKNLVRDTVSHKKGYKALSDFLEGKGFDVKGDLEDQWTNTTGKSKTEVDALTKQVQKLTGAYEKMEKENLMLAEEKETNTLSGVLSDKMKDVIGGKDQIELWVKTKRVKLSEGKPVYFDGTKELPLETAVESWKKENPDRIRVDQSAGGGSHPAAKENGGQQKQTLKKGDFSKLTMAAKKDFFDKGGEIVSD